MLRRTLLKGIAASAAGGLIARPAVADTTRKSGMSVPMTGAGFAAVGRQLKAAIQLYTQQHGDTVAGRKIELTMRDDGGVADVAGDRAAGDRSEEGDPGLKLGRLDHDREVALLRACRLHPQPTVVDHGR